MRGKHKVSYDVKEHSVTVVHVGQRVALIQHSVSYLRCGGW